MSDCGDIILRFIQLLAEAQPSFSEQVAADIESQLRHEYAGERVYIPKRRDVRSLIAERFTGNNAGRLTREMRVSRSTVYRAIRKRKNSKV